MLAAEELWRADGRLEQERKELLTEGRDLDKKIEEIKARLAARQCTLNASGPGRPERPEGPSETESENRRWERLTFAEKYSQLDSAESHISIILSLIGMASCITRWEGFRRLRWWH